VADEHRDVFVIGSQTVHDYQDLRKLCLINILFRPDKLNLHLADLASLPGYQALFTTTPTRARLRQINSSLYLSSQELDAATLLRKNEETITEIAFRVGFSDSNYFSR
jgi:hypothetical protein